jgi:putative photosynthetic complex assembly protein
MGDPFRGPFPRAPLIAAGVLLALVIATVVAVRVTGAGRVGIAATPPPQRVLEMRFEDQADGSVRVIDVATSTVVTVLPSGQGGFVRSSIRSLARERRRFGAGADAPFVLAEGANGRLTLDDPATGIRLDLAAFGPTNAAAFDALLDAAESAQAP